MERPGNGGRVTTCLQRTLLLVACPVLLALTACANRPFPLLYDDTRVKQAAAAKDDWKAVDVAGVITAQQTNLKALLDAENKAQADANALQARLELTALLGKPLFDDGLDDKTGRALVGNQQVPAGLGSKVGARFIQLVGMDYATPEPLPPPKAGEEDKLVVQHWDFAVLRDRYKTLKTHPYQAAATAKTAAMVLASYQATYRRFGVTSVPSCADFKAHGTYSDSLNAALKAALPPLTDAQLKSFAIAVDTPRKTCALVETSTDAELEAVYGKSGLIASARDDLNDAKTAANNAKTQEQAAEKVYNDAKSEYAALVKHDGSPTPSADAVNKAAAKLETALKNLDSASTDTQGLSDVFVTQERLTQFQNYLDELQSGLKPSTTTVAGDGTVTANSPSGEAPAPAAGVSAPVAATAASAAASASTASSSSGDKVPPSVAAIVTVTRLVDDIHDYTHAAETAKQLPLQLMAEQERLKLQAAQAVTAERAAQVALLQQIVTNLEGQADELYLAMGYLTAVNQALPKDPAHVVNNQCEEEKWEADWRRRTYTLLFCAQTSAVKLPLLQATVDYFDVIQRLDTEYLQLQYARLDAMDREVVALDDANLLRWQALVTPTVNGLSDYYASGITPQTFANLISAVSLVWIGHGVNK